MNNERLKEAFMQGNERGAAELFGSMMRGIVRAGLYEAMAAEVESFCGARYHPDKESPYQRAGSEKGVAYLDGGKEEIVRPRVRHSEKGEVRLDTYRAASSQRGLPEQGVIPFSVLDWNNGFGICSV